MRKKLISALMIPLLLLTGCGEREAKLQNGFADFRQSLNEEKTVTATVELTANLDDSEQTYILVMTAEAGKTRLVITEPELLAGVAATVTDDGAEVSYDDVALAVPPVSEEGITPVSALPAILKAAREGYRELLWWDDGYIAARFYAGKSSTATVWIDPDSLALKWAEISTDGQTVICCTFSDWSIT